VFFLVVPVSWPAKPTGRCQHNQDGGDSSRPDPKMIFLPIHFSQTMSNHRPIIKDDFSKGTSPDGPEISF
jgi:hypothetical protein